MRFLFSLLLGIGVCLGCSSTNRIDVLEARLREQEIEVQDYEREIASVRSQLAVAQRESKILRGKIEKSGETTPAVEATQALAAVEGLKFNNLLTAGQNKDNREGDERLHAIVTPHDADGELVKVIGDIELEAIDLSRPEAERTIGHWTYDPEQAKELWHSGFLSSGYRFDVPWEKLPGSKEVLLHVKMKTPDGRELTANHTVKIVPPQELAPAADEPDLVNPPNDIQQVGAEASPKGEKPTEEQGETKVAEESAEKLERPEPVLELFEEEAPGKVELKPISYETPKPTEGNSGPRPFPSSGVQTSDNWTDATIPRLR